MEIIKPANEQEWLALRTKDITSTEIGALFGISPYTTAFELWHRKKSGDVVSIETNDRMKWGTRLQDSIAKGIAEDNKWNVVRMDEYIRLPEESIGASFDFSIEPSDGLYGLLEIKNVDALQFKDGWIVDGDNMEAPPHIELQVQHQLLVSGRSFAYIGALIGGNKVVLVRREPDPAIHEAIKIHARAFWKSIEDNIPPEPNFEKDASFISKLYNFASPGKVLQAENDAAITELATKYKSYGDIKKAAEVSQDAIKAQLLTKIGDAEKIIGNGFKISAGIIGPAHIEYDRNAYRNFKISWPKQKEIKNG